MVNTKENIDKITVITINFNDVTGLEKTINSVLNQTYEFIEFIVIDGLSVDGSIELIGKYDNKIDYWCSEKDKGVYDAMNKGVQKANGDWIIFMNSGDVFYNDNIVESVFSHKRTKYDVLYGMILRPFNGEYRKAKGSKLCTFYYQLPFSHQSVFVRTSILRNRPFDLKYKIAADYDFFCYAYSSNMRFKNVYRIIGIRADGGISMRQEEQMYKEYDEISHLWFKGFKRKRMYCNYRIHVLICKIVHLINNKR